MYHHFGRLSFGFQKVWKYTEETQMILQIFHQFCKLCLFHIGCTALYGLSSFNQNGLLQVLLLLLLNKLKTYRMSAYMHCHCLLLHVLLHPIVIQGQNQGQCQGQGYMILYKYLVWIFIRTCITTATKITSPTPNNFQSPWLCTLYQDPGDATVFEICRKNQQ